jgi:hypothetical protein
MKRWKLAAVVAGLVLACGTVLPVVAQQGGGGGGGGRGNFDPAAMQAAMEARMKTSLGVSDDEWKVLQPMIQKVNTARAATISRGFGGGGGGRGGRGGAGGGGGGGGPAANTQPATPLATAQAALTETLANKDATPDQIKAKLDALRAARAKAREELTKAQDELKKVVTVRQEAVLVGMGTLE